MTRVKQNTHALSRRSLLKTVAVAALSTTCLSALGQPVMAADAKKVIIGAFADGGLTPFKDKIIPLAREAGFDV